MMSPTAREKAHSELATVPTRVLVIDDEALIRWWVCTALAAEGFEAVSASDPASARRLAAEWPRPRVVLFDVRTPDTDALDVLFDIRRVCPDCRFVIMTTARHYSLEYRFTDGVELIQKPFDVVQIVRLVKELADRRISIRPVPGAGEQPSLAI